MNGYVNVIVGGILALGVIGAVTTLAWHGTINGEAAVGIYSTIIAGGGAAVIHRAAKK